MPDVKVCLWNIQNYGRSNLKYGDDEDLRNRFIAAFVKANAIDILLIQEVSSDPRAALGNLQLKLNAKYRGRGEKQDWSYSYCGCAIKSDGVTEAKKKGDLKYRTGARTEGYAVVWRREQTARYTMIDAVYPIASFTGPASRNLTSPLNINQYGRPSGGVRSAADGKTYFQAKGGFTLANKYPYEDGTLMNEWPKLNYPRTSRQDSRKPNWSKSRRPVYVVIKLEDGEDNLCPISVYHAPSSTKRASWGAFVAGLARELYSVNSLKADGTPDPADYVSVKKRIFGGDFNLSVRSADWPGDFRYFTATRSKTYTGGARCEVAPLPTGSDADRRTTVQILQDNHKMPITSATASDYLRFKIDLAFFQYATATRIDILDALINDPADIYKSTIEKVYAAMNAVVQDIPNHADQRMDAVKGPQKQVTRKKKTKWVPLICGAWGGTFVNWPTTMAQFQAGDITAPRQAAEYFHIFVSDHLPLVATIDL